MLNISNTIKNLKFHEINEFTARNDTKFGISFVIDMYLHIKDDPLLYRNYRNIVNPRKFKLRLEKE